MHLAIKHLRTDPHTHDDVVVKQGDEYGFWRIVELTGKHWFPWPELYTTREAAQVALLRLDEKTIRQRSHSCKV